MLLVGRRPASKRARRDRQRGGAAVEFALIMPLFLAILFGIIDYGWYFYQRYALVAAVRDGVRYGVTFPAASAQSNAKLQAIADLQVAGSPINYLNVTWGPTSPGTSTLTAPAPAMTVMTLSASMPFKPLAGLVPVPATVRYQFTMLLEQQAGP